MAPRFELGRQPDGRWHFRVYSWTGELAVHGYRATYADALRCAQGWLR